MPNPVPSVVSLQEKQNRKKKPTISSLSNTNSATFPPLPRARLQRQHTFGAAGLEVDASAGLACEGAPSPPAPNTLLCQAAQFSCNLAELHRHWDLKWTAARPQPQTPWSCSSGRPFCKHLVRGLRQRTPATWVWCFIRCHFGYAQSYRMPRKDHVFRKWPPTTILGLLGHLLQETPLRPEPTDELQ